MTKGHSEDLNRELENMDWKDIRIRELESLIEELQAEIIDLEYDLQNIRD